MKKLKDKLIHLLGGFTTEDMMVRTRPVKVRTFESDVRTLEVRQVIRRDMMAMYPDYIENYAKKDMVYRLGDRLLEDGLVLVTSNESELSDWDEHIEVRARLNVVVPYE